MLSSLKLSSKRELNSADTSNQRFEKQQLATFKGRAAFQSFHLGALLHSGKACRVGVSVTIRVFSAMNGPGKFRNRGVLFRTKCRLLRRGLGPTVFLATRHFPQHNFVKGRKSRPDSAGSDEFIPFQGHVASGNGPAAGFVALARHKRGTLPR